MAKKIISGELGEKIFDMYNKGKTVADISRLTGLSAYSTISKYLKSRGVHIKSVNPNKKYFLDERFFSEINTEAKAYWLGFLMADGYVRQERRKTDNKLLSRIELVSQQKDHDHLVRFGNDLNSNYPVIKRAYGKNGISVIEIYNKTICEDLIRHGCIQKKSLVLEFPLHLDREYFSDIMRGYFDGDGTVFQTKQKLANGKNSIHIRASICSGSLGFLTECQEILKENYITTTINSGDGVFIMSIASKDIMRFHSFMYSGKCLFLARKESRFHISD